MKLSIITLNTWKCDGAYPKRLDLIADVLQSIEFDILLGQEVFVSETFSTESILANDLNSISYFEKSRYKQREFNGEQLESYSGLCVWTKHKISRSHRLVLPTTAQDGERIAQVFSLDVNGSELVFINTHLTHLKNESTLRIEQIDTLINYANAEFNPAGIVLCGDLNAEKNDKEISYLTSSQGFIDAYPTCTRSHTSGRCIDHVFYYPADVLTVKKATTILDTPAQGVLPSDHFGLCIELELG